MKPTVARVQIEIEEILLAVLDYPALKDRPFAYALDSVSERSDYLSDTSTAFP